jgi:uncharacterized protein (DUF924 family)
MAPRFDQSALAADILKFWFEDAGPKKWFRRSDAFDAEVKQRFLPAFDAATSGELDAMRATRDGSLALVLVLDQFSRNMFRGTPRAFEQDAEARAIARNAITRRFDMAVPEERRAFFYMPFMHSEGLADQEYSVALFTARCHANVPYAVEHRDIIARFGRFPHRNEVLGRASTADEIAFLKAGGFNP